MKFLLTETQEIISKSELREIFNSNDNDYQKENGTNFESYIYDLQNMGLIKEVK